MEEKELFKKINEESENNVPDVYDKILFAAHAQGLFNNGDNAEVYSDGETVALGGVNKRAVAITTLAAIAAVSLAVALPIALSGKYDSGLNIPPVGNGDEKIVAEIDLGDTYSYGAVTTARLAEELLNEPASAKAMAKRTASADDFNAFGKYFSALDCFLGDDLSTAVANPSANYQKSITISGRRVSGDPVYYAMSYTEYKIVKQDYVSGSPVDYYLEGEIIVMGYGTVSLIGERTLASDADGAEETAFNVYAYPSLSDSTTYAQMKLEFEEIDGFTVKSYSYKVVSHDYTVSEAVAYKPADADLAIKIKEGEMDKGFFTVLGKSEDGEGYKGNFDFGRERGEFTIEYTTNGFKYEFPDPAVDTSFLGYRDNGDGTYTLSTYDKNVGLPETLVVPATYNGKPVIGIGDSALRSKDLKKIILSEGITKIEKDAFKYCEQLEEVEFPSTLTYIGESAFQWCDKLNEINLPSNLIEIGYSAFSGCTGLTSVTIPEGVTTIAEFAFSNCSELMSAKLPSSLRNLGRGVFQLCSKLESLTVAQGNPVYRSSGNCVIDIENKNLISGCKNSVIPDDGSVINIYHGAFYGMGLTKLNLPSTVKEIFSSAFANNAFQSVTLPEGLIGINESAFEGCKLLESISLPSSLVAISSLAFYGCSSLTAVHIPENVLGIDASAFGGCKSLEKLTVDGKNKVYYSSNNCIIHSGLRMLVVGCKTSLIPEGCVEIIGKQAFWLSEITEITIPSGVTTIEKSAFGLSKLKSIVIPDSVTVIENNAFNSCYDMETVVLSENLEEIGYAAFFACSNLKSITIPESVTSIGYGAFGECSALTEVIWKSPAQEVGDSVFAGCKSLVNVVLPEGLDRLSSMMFRICSALETVTIPKTVTNIDAQALYGCVNLKEIIFTGTETEWEAIQKDGETWDWDAGRFVGGYTVKCLGEESSDNS